MLIRRRIEKRSRGQGLVEFAVVLPLLMMLLLMAIDFGRVFFGWVGLQNAARIGANYAAMYSEADWADTDDPKREDYIARIGADAGGINCTLPDPLPMPSFPGGTDVGNDAVVSLTCDFSLVTPFIGAITGDPIQLSATSIFPIRSGIVGSEGSGGPPPPPPPTCIEAPNLDDLTVGSARAAWQNATFTGMFFPAAAAGQDAEIVVSQFPLAGACVAQNSTMTVDSDPDTSACASGEARVPKLVGLSVEAAEAAWTASFDGFLPTVTSSNRNKTVDSQVTSPSFSAGACAPDTTDVTVTFVNGQLKCKVPNFIGSHSSGAQSTWSAAGFGTTVGFLSGTPYLINQQTLVSGSEVKCDESITLGP